MLALYRAGRQAEALDAYQDARARFVDELGIEPGAELRQLQAEILRHEAGLAPGPRTAARATRTARSSRRSLAGRVVPVLGLDGAADLATHLARAFDVPERPARSTSRASRSTSRR